MYTKEELETKTVDELRKIAPKVGVKGCRKLKKPELIAAIAAIVDEHPRGPAGGADPRAVRSAEEPLSE